MVQDFRFAFRMLYRTPFFSAALIGILALGIGGATAMFSVVYGVLLNPRFYEPVTVDREAGARG